MPTLSVNTSLPSLAPKWLIKDPNTKNLLACSVDSKRADCVDGITNSGHYTFDEPVNLIAAWEKGLVTYGSKGFLRKQLFKSTWDGFELKIEHPLCMAVSPSGNRIVLGGYLEYCLVDLLQKTTVKVNTQGQSWYCALFLDENQVWISGSNGGLRKIAYTENDCNTSIIDLGFKGNLYTICQVDEFQLIVAGSSGKVFKLHLPEGSIAWECSFGETVRTSTARMQSVSSITDNEMTRRFIFEPDSIKAEDGILLKENLDSNNLLFSDCATSAPIFIVGSNEGLLYVLDLRDGRLVECIDNAAGRATDIDGICFFDDKQFATLDRSGTVRIYSLSNTSYENALRYIDEANWERRISGAEDSP